MTTETSVSLHGPYQLSRSTVVRTVTLTYPGVYVLSRDGRNAHYVGRSDRDVKGRLLDHTGSRYTVYWFAYAISSWDAFHKECILYHQYGGSSSLDNQIHPQRPAGTPWRCPGCRAYS